MVLTIRRLFRVARELHDRVLRETPGYEEALADLISVIDRLPPNTAAALYLGLRRLARLECYARKPGGIDWTAILAKAATSPPIHSPYWQTAEGQGVQEAARAGTSTDKT